MNKFRIDTSEIQLLDRYTLIDLIKPIAYMIDGIIDKTTKKRVGIDLLTEYNSEYVKHLISRIPGIRFEIIFENPNQKRYRTY